MFHLENIKYSEANFTDSKMKYNNDKFFEGGKMRKRVNRDGKSRLTQKAH